MARTIFTFVGLGLLAGCSLPGTVDRLQQHSPPPELGRPGWVRTCAGTGGFIGGVIGGVVSIVVLPVTYPVSLLAGDSLGGEVSRNEFLLFPMTGGAAIGHFLLGGPPDLLDFTFRRAWSGEQLPENTYELVPMEPPQTPVAPSKAPATVPDAPKTDAPKADAPEAGPKKQ